MKVESIFILKNRNTREEKLGPEETRIALDLKFNKSVPLDMLDELLPAHTSKGIAAFYDKKGGTENNGMMLAPPIKGVEMAVAIKLDVPSAQPLEFEDCKLDKISIVLSPGRVVDLTFRVIVYPTPEQDGQLGAMLHKEVHLTAEGVQGELDLSKKEEKKEDGEDE